jgi:hypothetical protein
MKPQVSAALGCQTTRNFGLAWEVALSGGVTNRGDQQADARSLRLSRAHRRRSSGTFWS